MCTYITSNTHMKKLCTSLALVATVAGVLLPSSAAAMRYDRINKSLPGHCLSKEFRQKAAKLCRDVGPGYGIR